MPDDATLVGTRVRLLPDFYIRELIPPNNWTGTIMEVRKSLMGQRTQYVVHLDEQFQSQEKDVSVFEEEMEQC